MPEKRKPLQGERPIRGELDDIQKITENGYSGKIPTEDIMAMERELYGLRHGEVSLAIVVRDGRFQFTRISKVVTRNGNKQ
jgi:hypothetical protein